MFIRSRRCAHEDDEVIRVPNWEHRHPTSAKSITFAAVPGALVDLCRSGSERRSAAWPHPSLVPLVDHAERDVGEQWRQNSTLRGAVIDSDELSFREDAGFQECSNETVHLRVCDATANALHQTMVV